MVSRAPAGPAIEHLASDIDWSQDRRDRSRGQDEARKAAIERLKAKRAFLSLLGTAALVITVRIVIWALSDSGSFWPVWVMVGFGFALAGSGWRAYGPARSAITEDEIQREMDRGTR